MHGDVLNAHGGAFEAQYGFFHVFQRAATHKHNKMHHTTTHHEDREDIERRQRKKGKKREKEERRTHRQKQVPFHNRMHRTFVIRVRGNPHSDVWAVVPRLQSSERLFHASAQAFRREFHSWVAHPYSLRRGGATVHDMEFGNLDRTMMRGKWASIKTTRLYVNSVVVHR